MIPERYVERVYAGFLGMNVGIRLGAPIEPVVWTHDRIQDVFGDIRNYVKDYTNFSADDDANGPIFFIRALYDDAVGRELEAEDVARAWLNYAREGIGMFWWGGEGVSTEHTAYLNLKKGIPAPRSGSGEVNGWVLAEQIGGQIFVDSWGLLFPGRMGKAAEYAEKAASVSHDGNGLYGARFIAACIAKAFEASSIGDIIAAGLAEIPADSTYAQLVRAVIGFHREHPGDFHACFTYLENHWGYDKYPGVCHIIPNAGVCVLALLYGNGDFARTVEIASMCGWDTDCNAGSVGSILGVFAGLDAIPEHYRKPINDCIVASSVSGYLNIVDLPTFSKELALLGYRLAGVAAPSTLANRVKPGELYFDFDLPGSTHGFRVSRPFKTNLVRHSRKRGFRSEGSLEVLFDRLVAGDRSKLYYKPYYRRADFNDEKYKPTFAPQAYSGQTVSAEVYLDQWEGEPLVLIPYVRDTFSKEDILLEPRVTPVNGTWTHLEFPMPDLNGSFADEIGWVLESPSPLMNRAIGTLHLGEFRVYGKAGYSIDIAKQAKEYTCVTPFSHNRGEWTIADAEMRCVSDEDASAFTGNYYAKNYTVQAAVRPEAGDSHGLIARSLGVMRYYFAGFDGAGNVSIVKRDFGGDVRLAQAAFDWQPGVEYRLRATVDGSRIALFIDDRLVLEAEDASFGHGMFGCGHLRGGETAFSDFSFSGE